MRTCVLVKSFVKDSAFIGLRFRLAGLILVALLPDVAEIVNGIKFALEDNIALSIEVSSGSCILSLHVSINTASLCVRPHFWSSQKDNNRVSTNAAFKVACDQDHRGHN